MVYCGGANGSIITLTGSAKWTWEKYNATYYYYWQQYDAVISYYTEKKLGSSSRRCYRDEYDVAGLYISGANSYLRYYDSYKFNSTTGKYSVSRDDRNEWYASTDESSSYSPKNAYWNGESYYDTYDHDNMDQIYRIRTYTVQIYEYGSTMEDYVKADYDRYGAEPHYMKGSTSYGRISSTNSSAYPANGNSGNRWYVSDGSEWIKGTFIQTVTADSDRAYPDNGVHTDNYWYVKI